MSGRTGTVQAGDLRVGGSVVVPAAELRWRFSRSSGPGGQHANTSDTRVSLSLDVARSRAFGQVRRERILERMSGRLTAGVVTVTAEEHRSQARNREMARERLAALLAEAMAPPPRGRRATRPSRAARERRLSAKRRRGDLKRSRSRRGDE